MDERTPKSPDSSPERGLGSERSSGSGAKQEAAGGSGRGALSERKHDDEDLRLYGGWWTATWFLDGL